MEPATKQQKLPIFLLLLIPLFVLLIIVWPKSSTPKAPKENDSSTETRVTWIQKSISSAMLLTDKDTKDDQKEVHVVFRSFMNMSVPSSDIKSVKVTLQRFLLNKGTGLFIHPTDKSMSNEIQSYIFTNDPELTERQLVTGSKTASYVVVDGLPTKFNEIPKAGGIINFAFISKNLGNYSTNAILKRDNIYDSGKSYEYAGLTAKDLTGSVMFDVEITFTDGKIYKKRFTAEIDGEKVKSDSFYTLELSAQ